MDFRLFFLHLCTNCFVNFLIDEVEVLLETFFGREGACDHRGGGRRETVGNEALYLTIGEAQVEVVLGLIEVHSCYFVLGVERFAEDA